MMDENRIPDSIKERIEEYYRNLDRWTYYDLLYITRSAALDDIKRGYRKMVQLMHPDRYGHDLAPDYKAKLEKIFNEINRAYNVLKDSSDRIRYDQSLFIAEDHNRPLKVDTETQVADAQYKKGIIALQKKQILPAIEFFRYAVQLAPENPEYYAKLALALSNHQNPRIRREAIEACKEAIKRNQENANYHALMGRIYQKETDLDEAELHYRRALTWNPSHLASKRELKNIAFARSRIKSQSGLKGKISAFFKAKPSSKR
jgi:curved DNA-binding protein CbpA